MSNLVGNLAFKWVLIVLASLYLYAFWERRDNGRYVLNSISPTVVMDTRTGSVFALGGTGAVTGWVESIPHTGETLLHSKPIPKDTRDGQFPPVH